jgi:hypothetical protein
MTPPWHLHPEPGARLPPFDSSRLRASRNDSVWFLRIEARRGDRLFCQKAGRLNSAGYFSAVIVQQDALAKQERRLLDHQRVLMRAPRGFGGVVALEARYLMPRIWTSLANQVLAQGRPITRKRQAAH